MPTLPSSSPQSISVRRDKSAQHPRLSPLKSPKLHHEDESVPQKVHMSKATLEYIQERNPIRISVTKNDKDPEKHNSRSLNRPASTKDNMQLKSENPRILKSKASMSRLRTDPAYGPLQCRSLNATSADPVERPANTKRMSKIMSANELNSQHDKRKMIMASPIMTAMLQSRKSQKIQQKAEQRKLCNVPNEINGLRQLSGDTVIHGDGIKVKSVPVILKNPAIGPPYRKVIRPVFKQPVNL